MQQRLSLQTASSWIERYSKLQKTKDILEQHKRDLEAKDPLIRSKEITKGKAEKARLIEHFHQSLKKLRKDINERNDEIYKKVSKIMEENDTKAGLLNKEKQLKDRSAELEIESQKLEETIKKVAPIDREIDKLLTQRKNVTENCGDAKRNKDIAEENVRNLLPELTACQKAFNEEGQWLKDNQPISILASETEDLSHCLFNWQAACKALREAQAETSKAKKAWDEWEADWEKADGLTLQIFDDFEKASQKVQRIDNEITHLLAGASKDQLGTDEKNIEQKERSLDDAIKAVELLLKTGQELAAKNAEKSQ